MNALLDMVGLTAVAIFCFCFSFAIFFFLCHWFDGSMANDCGRGASFIVFFLFVLSFTMACAILGMLVFDVGLFLMKNEDDLT